MKVRARFGMLWLALGSLWPLPPAASGEDPVGGVDLPALMQRLGLDPGNKAAWAQHVGEKLESDAATINELEKIALAKELCKDPKDLERLRQFACYSKEKVVTQAIWLY